MPKEKIKRAALEKMRRDGRLADLARLEELTGKTVAEMLKETELIDPDRPIPRVYGGEYDPDNVEIMEPRQHMERHGILRLRTPALDDLKTRIDNREIEMGIRNAIQNKLLALKRRTDHADSGMKGYLEEELAKHNRRLAVLTKSVEDGVLGLDDPLVKSALGVCGVGPITVAYCAVYIDLTGVFPEKKWDGTPHPRAGQPKSPHISSLWEYAGIGGPSHERYEKGRAGGGNRRLRTALYLLAETQVKLNGMPDKNGKPRPLGAYHGVYVNDKARLMVSPELVGKRPNGERGGENSRNTKGKLVEVAWKDAKPGHRDGAAKRRVMKMFLADWWIVGRTILGLPLTQTWVEMRYPGAGHRTSPPTERGWAYQAAGGKRGIA